MTHVYTETGNIWSDNEKHNNSQGFDLPRYEYRNIHSGKLFYGSSAAGTDTIKFASLHCFTLNSLSLALHRFIGVLLSISKCLQRPTDLSAITTNFVASINSSVRYTGCLNIIKMLKRTCLQNALNAIAKANLEEMPLEQNGDFYGLTLLGRGVTYIVWLVSCLSNKGTICKFVLRVPKVIGMLPELRNEIGWLRYVSKHIPGVPIPKVYAFNITQKIDDCFIAEEYIVGEPLSKMWALYTDDEKHSVALKLAEVIVDLAAARFESICGLTPELEPGPAIEVPKLFECRV